MYVKMCYDNLEHFGSLFTQLVKMESLVSFGVEESHTKIQN